jgi:hypothetical protein
MGKTMDLEPNQIPVQFADIPSGWIEPDFHGFHPMDVCQDPTRFEFPWNRMLAGVTSQIEQHQNHSSRIEQGTEKKMDHPETYHVGPI